MPGSTVRWDELYVALLKELRDSGRPTGPTKGSARELVAKQFVIADPRDRCLANEPRSFNLFQVVGHWLWIMQGRMDLPSIQYYNPRSASFSSDQRKLGGAYGPRLFGLGAHDQIPHAIDLIRKRKDTRRAVATVYIPEFDVVRRAVGNNEDEVPCTVALQYIPREGLLHAISFMRSQDVLMVLPYDVFLLTLLQEYVARSTGNALGSYHHFAGSFHYYRKHDELLERVCGAATATPPLMPDMPEGDPAPMLASVVALEETIRSDSIARSTLGKADRFRPGAFIDAATTLPEFWGELVLSLVAWSAIRLKDVEALRQIHEQAGQPLRFYIARELARLSSARSLDRFRDAAP